MKSSPMLLHLGLHSVGQSCSLENNMEDESSVREQRRGSYMKQKQKKVKNCEPVLGLCEKKRLMQKLRRILYIPC